VPTACGSCGAAIQHHAQSSLETYCCCCRLLFVSERQAQLTRQAVNYVARLAGEKAKLGGVCPTCSGTPAAIMLWHYSAQAKSIHDSFTLAADNPSAVTNRPIQRPHP
jgi:hypothetical protein